MNSENSQMAIVSIFAGITFILGLGIGVQLYSVTSKSSSVPDSTSFVSNQSGDRQVEKTDFNK